MVVCMGAVLDQSLKSNILPSLTALRVDPLFEASLSWTAFTAGSVAS